MSTFFIKDNPLHIPEVRSCVSRYVSVADAISCVRVSKDWSTDFAFLIWFAVNFNTHSSFEQLNATVIARHGHLIRKIHNLSTQGQLNALLHPNISNVRVLSLSCTTTARFRILCMDLVSNNNKSLETLSMKMYTDDLSVRTISLDAVVPHLSDSRLTTITLRNVCVSRASFVALLKGCPLLTSVSMLINIALLSGPSIDTFQHTGVASLSVNLEGVFKPDPDSEVSALGFSLLAHFPNLNHWTLYPLEATLIDPIEHIIAEVKLCCPKVSQVYTWTTQRPLLYNLLARVFRNLVKVIFAYEQLSADVVLALLLHKATLIEVSTTCDNKEDNTERDHIPIESDHFQTSGLAIQLLLRSYQNLTAFKLERHEMYMDIVEEAEWVCKGLRSFRVRVRGLDTTEKINRTLELWADGRKNKSQFTQIETNDMSIEARVARHLLTFDNLERVWLGTRTRIVKLG